MAVIDILIYVFFAIVMSTLAKKSYKTYPKSTKLDVYLIQFILFYTFISAIKWKVGADSIGYAKDFVTGIMGADAEGAEYKELISQFIVHSVHNLGLHFTVGVGIYSFLEIFFITKMLSKYKYVLIYVPIVLFGSRYYANEMNGMRQMIVASAFVYFSKYIFERKVLRYFSSILISTMVHQSSLILFPLYFLPRKITEIADKRYLLLAIFTTCLVIGRTPQFHMLTQYGETIGVVLGYQNYGVILAEKAEGDSSAEAKNIGPVLLSFIFIAFANIWYGKRLKKRYEKIIPYFNMWYFFSFLWGCTYFLFSNTDVIFTRPWSYFCLFEMIIFSLLLYDLSTNIIFNSKKRLIAICFIIAAWIGTSYSIIKAENDPKNDWITYKFYFMHQDEVDALKRM